MYKDKQYLAEKLKLFISYIFKEYGTYIPEEVKKDINLVDNYENLILFTEEAGINSFVRNEKVYLSAKIYDIYDILKGLSIYGIDKNYQFISYDNMIINDNTYKSFFEYVVITGLTSREIFEKFLLHEAMHLCNGSGGEHLNEGFNELKTRELAYKYRLNAGCFNYSKEVKIVYKLQELFGKDIINQITFMNDKDVIPFLMASLGEDAAYLYIRVKTEMSKLSSMYRCNRIKSSLKDCLRLYENIDYSTLYEIIDSYKNRLIKKLD